MGRLDHLHRTEADGEPAMQAFQPVVQDEALARGLVAYPGSGSLDGVAGDHVKLTPPLILSEAQVDEMVLALKGALDATAARLGALATV